MIAWATSARTPTSTISVRRFAMPISINRDMHIPFEGDHVPSNSSQVQH
jgi:hypothetical protein